MEFREETRDENEIYIKRGRGPGEEAVERQQHIIDGALTSAWVFVEQKLMKRISRGPVRGISLKLQEEERERRMDFVPEVSIVDVAEIEIDRDTKDMLRALDMPNLPNVVVRDNVAPSGGRPAYQRR